MKSYTKPVKVVLDTNIVVSALLAKYGQPAKLFEAMINRKIENYTSREIIDEIESVFNRKEICERTDEKAREFIVKQYKKHSKTVSPKQKLSVVEDDPKDNKFIECAVEANAQYIISGDPHLIRIAKYSGIRILKKNK